MVHVFSEVSKPIIVPDWVSDLESFRKWIDSDDVPEKAPISYLGGEVWLDVSREQVLSHVLVKTQYTITVGGLAAREQKGLYLGDGVRLTNLEVGFSVKPDGLFVSNGTLESGLVRLSEGMEEGYLELEGTPDMVLEVVSTSSVQKDTKVLRQAYAEAGIREYWLVDARQDPLIFDILRLTSRGYVGTRKVQGWVKSAVFTKSFRVVRRTTSLGHPDYMLEMR